MALLGMAVVANDLFKYAPPLHGSAERPGIWTIFGNLVFAPVVETVLLIGLLKLLVRIKLHEVVAIVVSAILWGVLHGTLEPLRFFGSIWSFAVFGYSYFLWHRRQPDRGFAAASVTHGLVNAVSTLFIFFDYYALRISG
jgi:membrane protease YdiL (CAAX protease family)